MGVTESLLEPMEFRQSRTKNLAIFVFSGFMAVWTLFVYPDVGPRWLGIAASVVCVIAFAKVGRRLVTNPAVLTLTPSGVTGPGQVEDGGLPIPWSRIRAFGLGFRGSKFSAMEILLLELEDAEEIRIPLGPLRRTDREHRIPDAMIARLKEWGR